MKMAELLPLKMLPYVLKSGELNILPVAFVSCPFSAKGTEMAGQSTPALASKYISNMELNV